MTRTFPITVPPDGVAIVDGFTVDGVSGGVYKVLGEGTHNVTITDGEYHVVSYEQGNHKFCEELRTAAKNNWARAHKFPLPGWYDCGVN